METEEAGTVTTDDGLSVETTGETSEAMKANFASEPKPLDGESEDPKAAEKKKRSEAAAELGKAGGEATAKARADDGLVVDAEGKPEKTEPAQEAKAEVEPEKSEAKPEPDDSLGADPRSSAQARMKQATKKLAEERDKNRVLEAKMDVLGARMDALSPQADPKPAAAADDEPQVEKFETYEEYVRATGRWEAKKEFQAQQQEARKVDARERATQSILERVDSFNARLEEATKADPELMSKFDKDIMDIPPSMNLPPNIPPRPENDIIQAAFDSEHTALLLLYLSAHPEEMVRLTGLPDTNAVFRAMGNLEAKVTTTPAPRLVPVADAEPPVSSAKPPVKPVSGSAQRSEEDVTDDMSLDEHMRIYNARDERERRGRQ